MRGREEGEGYGFEACSREEEEASFMLRERERMGW